MGDQVEENNAPNGDLMDEYQEPMPRPRQNFGRRELPSMQRSYFGKQADSTKSSRPAIGFGTAARFPPQDRSNSKQYISKEHMKYGPGSEDVPAPGTYQIESTFGEQKSSWKRSSPKIPLTSGKRFAEELRREKMVSQLPSTHHYKVGGGHGNQVNSLKPTEPAIGFGTATRDQKASIAKGFEEDLFGKDSPGPAVYEPVSSVGKQAPSGRTSGPHHVFGTEICQSDPLARSSYERYAATIPGPGQYNMSSSVGFQASSLRRTKPMFKMGTATRDQAAVASVNKSQSHTVFAGKKTPGVGTYETPPSVLQVDLNSQRRNPKNILFGSEARFLANRSTALMAPGPGSYCT